MPDGPVVANHQSVENKGHSAKSERSKSPTQHTQHTAEILPSDQNMPERHKKFIKDLTKYMQDNPSDTDKLKEIVGNRRNSAENCFKAMETEEFVKWLYHNDYLNLSDDLYSEDESGEEEVQDSSISSADSYSDEQEEQPLPHTEETQRIPQMTLKCFMAVNHQMINSCSKQVRVNQPVNRDTKIHHPHHRYLRKHHKAK